MAASLARQGVMPRGRCLAALLALAALASPHRLSAAAVDASGGKWHVVPVRTLLPSASCTAGTEAAPNSSTLRVVHRHGPCSPLQPGRDPPSHAELLARDRERADAILRKIGCAAASKGASVTLQACWGQPLGTSDYFFMTALGTPPRNLCVELDTGSELSWVQCKPCSDCYKQHDPLFDPNKSSTYSAVSCGAQECQDFGDFGLQQNCSLSNLCRYEVSYGDSSQTVGNLAQDTLTLTPGTTVPGFIFGCGHDDAGVFGELDGLFGLGLGKSSLSSQVAAKYGAGFSYCLPSSASTVGYLTFGVAAAPANTQFTAMPNHGGSFYYLNLTAIKVAGKAIKAPPAAFATAAGTIIDSGTAFSRLPPRVYAALRSSFRRAMGERYKRVPAPAPFDTCYDLSGHEAVRVPSVELVFGDGATVALHPSGVLYAWDDLAQTCLAFAPSPEEPPLGVLGNTQQRTLAVVYDVGNQRIGFGAQGCA